LNAGFETGASAASPVAVNAGMERLKPFADSVNWF